MNRGTCQAQSMGSQRVGHDWATNPLRLTSYYSSQCHMEVNVRCSSLCSAEVAILSFLTPLFYSLLTFFPLHSITSQINYLYVSLFLSLFFWGNTIEVKKKRFNIYSALGISVWQHFDVTLLRIHTVQQSKHLCSKGWLFIWVFRHWWYLIKYFLHWGIFFTLFNYSRITDWLI